MHKLPDSLRVKAAADFLGVLPNTGRNGSGEGRVPTYRNPVDGYRLYRKADLERLLQAVRRSLK